MKYQLVVGPDKIVWVSLQPLIEDTNEALEKLATVNTDDLNSIDADIMNFNVMGLKAISTFLSVLVKEANSREDTSENITGTTVH